MPALLRIGAKRPNEVSRMITATVRYKLPPHIDYAACRAHFHKIAPGFREVKGLLSKHFIWSETGWAGGVYQWETLEDARRFYSGPWLDGIVERYGMQPQIEFYEVFALTDNARGTVELFESAEREAHGIRRPEERGRILAAAPRAQEPDRDATQRHQHRVLGARPDVTDPSPSRRRRDLSRDHRKRPVQRRTDRAAAGRR